MYIAEKYGTKLGGILGTLPSTIVIALLFLAINKDINFASKAAEVIPAELGVNILFLVVFAFIVHRSLILAFIISLSIWTILSVLIIIINLNNIYFSVIIYILTLIIALLILKKKKIESIKNVEVHYNKKKIVTRGMIAGLVISIAIILSNIGAIFSGIFSVFPAIIISTMIISYREYGPNFTSGLAKSMIIGISSVAVYASSVHFLYPTHNIIIGSILSYIASLSVTVLILSIRNMIK
jgi:hypothetical protein